ncbi:hypothetical protein [Metabacillus halosaccharovorans]|uniref:Uncharacterized protein n=1 Tax=Metabacillus halosaccharovorans TaxID=930124 RepID=A0ABT3DGT0_9BACI|nr:hypothetical protein [Metabacillus halosaccharovorans]MCV9886270.1 hypothetical protein [Metabacillus halosaccharovorans]
MKETIKPSKFQKEMITISMINFRNTQKGMGRKLFDISYQKVQKMNEQVELDGMEMIYISQSLRFQSKQFAQSGRNELAKLYRGYGDQIEKVRKAFQMRNMPEIAKNKKAASAGTLTA